MRTHLLGAALFTERSLQATPAISEHRFARLRHNFRFDRPRSLESTRCTILRSSSQHGTP